MVKHQTGNYKCHPCCKTREADAPKHLMAQKQLWRCLMALSMWKLCNSQLCKLCREMQSRELLRINRWVYMGSEGQECKSKYTGTSQDSLQLFAE